jgi:hypothetical protein
MNGADAKDAALDLATQIDAAMQARFLQDQRDATPEEREHEGQLGQRLLQALEQVEPGALNGRYEEMLDTAEHVIARAEGRPRGLKKPRAPLTDLGNAECFARDHAHGLRYVPGVGWLGWDGRRWLRDEDGASERAAKVTARSRRREGDELEADEAQKVYKWATASEAAPRLRNMVSLAESEESLIARVELLDGGAMAFNAQNGTVDLRAGELRFHRREDMHTKMAPVAFDPEARCPTFDRFLAEVVPDEEVRSYLQRAVGFVIDGAKALSRSQTLRSLWHHHRGGQDPCSGCGKARPRTGPPARDPARGRRDRPAASVRAWRSVMMLDGLEIRRAIEDVFGEHALVQRCHRPARRCACARPLSPRG